jgi:steroid delta-isomerase-like uncharacterized protein
MATTPAMSETAMRELHEAHVAAENRGDLKAALDLYTDDCYLQHVALGYRIEGKQKVADYYQMFQEAFPDSSYRIVGEQYGDDKLIAWGTWRSTARGPFLGVEPQPPGREITIDLMTLIRYRDGLILGEHLVLDFGNFLRQGGYDIDAVLAAAAQLPQRWAWDGLADPDGGPMVPPPE